MQVNRIDHLVLTVKDIEATVKFYSSVMGMNKVQFGEGRVALSFAGQKINLHQLGAEFEPKAQHVKTGSADLCFILDTALEEAIKELALNGVHIIEGPVQRTGAVGRIESVYFRDPDGNLIEIANYISE
ncbi:MAG: VOC family protein [Hahellaceae bacterium]|nr:VOC family protein [Hahellaceae bacterium]MCP5212296.1 VOC family protein [Hahellaceae bacterium]